MAKSREIKAFLREKGIDTKNIRITTDSSINVKLLDPKLNYEKIESILRDEYESYQRDEATGEILSGGNTFVFIEFDSNTVTEVSHQLQGLIKPFLDKCTGNWSVQSLVKHFVETNQLDYDIHLTKRAFQEALYAFLRTHASELKGISVDGWN